MRILRRIDIERSGEVYEKIESYVREVVKRLDPRLVILFGSFGEGDINEGSDVDLIVVADFKEGFLDRIKALMKLNRFGIPVEPLGYTPEEFDEMKGKNPFIEEILRKGKVLFRKE
ncbi:MAG: nucleotidyltransferase domain-containing protein [Candidatus Bathyarchaeia archaeon]|nr:nucleotidyltransferase domain-containing protein [Candidatus Bathyarchaeota archaeon]